MSLTIGPLTLAEGNFILAWLGHSTAYPLDTHTWAESGLPSGLTLAGVFTSPLAGGASGFAGHASASFQLEPEPMLVSGDWSAAYWYSPDGAAWTYHVQTQGICSANGTLGATQRVSATAGKPTLAAGYYQALTIIPAAMPHAWVPQFGYSGVPKPYSALPCVYVEGDLVEPGHYYSEITEAACNGYSYSITLTLTSQP